MQNAIKQLTNDMKRNIRYNIEQIIISKKKKYIWEKFLYFLIL